MFRSPLFIVLLAIALGAGAVRVYQLSRQISDLTAQNQDLEARNENLQSELLQAHQQEQSAFMGQQSSIEQLQAKIAGQKEAVALAEQRLRKQRNEGAGGGYLGGLREKLREQEQVIADLTQQLKEVHDHQAELRDQDKFYQQQAGADQKRNDQDLKAQISAQQQELQQLAAQLKSFKVNPWDSDSQDAYNALQAKVQAQRSAIQQLKEQRAQSGAEWGYQKAHTHVQAQQNSADLKTSEEEIQAQLQREKAAQASLQKDIQSGVQTQRSQKALLESAQADYDTQKAKLQDLESQLQAAQARLEKMSAN